MHADTNSGKLSYLNDFWVDVLKSGYGLLVHGTHRSAVSQDWIYELRWNEFLRVVSDALIFG